MERWIGAALLVLAAYQVYTGRFWSSNENGPSDLVSRSQRPFRFWLTVGLEIVFALILLLRLVHF